MEWIRPPPIFRPRPCVNPYVLINCSTRYTHFLDHSVIDGIAKLKLRKHAITYIKCKISNHLAAEPNSTA